MDVILANLLYFGATIPPGWKLVERSGLSSGWAFLLLVPFVGLLILLWVIACRQWPTTSLNQAEATS